MKKSLADQVREFIEWKGEGYTSAKLAADIAKFQRELPEKVRCKRQNIDSLLKEDFRTVRYLPALAAAMGTTAETLVAGTFTPGGEPGSAGQNDAANFLSRLDDEMIDASPRSLEVLDNLKLLAKKNILGDEDWDLIQQLAKRFHKDRKER